MTSFNWFVGRVYADHNSSGRIKRAISRALSILRDGELGLNVGASSSWHHPAVINFDLCPSKCVDCVGDAISLPFENSCFSLVLTQETLEHVSDAETAMAEIYRVLKPGGLLYCQLPFVIGYHPGPTDYWRFTREGIRQLIERSGLRCDEVSITVGPAVGFYRIAAEFGATVCARVSGRFYRPAKALFALLLYPIKWLDPFLINCVQADRIPGGFYAFASRNEGREKACAIGHSSP